MSTSPSVIEPAVAREHSKTLRQPESSQAPKLELFQRAAIGGLAGLAATVPMTIAMELLRPLVPLHGQLPTPQEPRYVTEGILRSAGLDHELSRTVRRKLTWLAHGLFGAACGAGLALIPRKVPFSKPVQGVLCGLGVWTASYAGWVPALGILPPPSGRPRGRNALMIAAHMVWGATAGYQFEWSQALLNHRAQKCASDQVSRNALASGSCRKTVG